MRSLHVGLLLAMLVLQTVPVRASDDLQVKELKPYDFDQWLATQEQWNPTSKAHAATLILSALSWARKKGFIVNNPLAGRMAFSGVSPGYLRRRCDGRTPG